MDSKRANTNREVLAQAARDGLPQETDFMIVVVAWFNLRMEYPLQIATNDED